MRDGMRVEIPFTDDELAITNTALMNEIERLELIAGDDERTLNSRATAAAVANVAKIVSARLRRMGGESARAVVRSLQTEGES
jgi:hypothetical protein